MKSSDGVDHLMELEFLYRIDSMTLRQHGVVHVPPPFPIRDTLPELHMKNTEVSSLNLFPIYLSFCNAGDYKNTNDLKIWIDLSRLNIYLCFCN